MIRPRNVAWLVVLAMAVLVSACGDESEPLDVIDYPFAEKAETLRINGAEFRTYIASTEAHRARARNGLTVSEGEAIAYVYPRAEDPVKVRFNNLPAACDLVFVDASGKVVGKNAVQPFSMAKFPQVFTAAKGADVRLVLQLPAGQAEKLKLSQGSAVKTEPDLLAASAEAEGEFTEMFFVKRDQPDEKPQTAPSVKLKVLEEAEEIAQGLKDRPGLKEGQGVLIPCGNDFHEFWLKGVEGPVSGCYLRRGAGRFAGGYEIASRFDSLRDAGTKDLDRPVWSSSEKVALLALFKGEDFFKKNKIEDNVVITFFGPVPARAKTTDFDNLEIAFGEDKLLANLAATGPERAAALLKAPGLEKNRATVFAFDAPEEVAFDPAGLSGEIRLLFLKEDGSIGEEKLLRPGSTAIPAGSVNYGRFVIAAPKGAKTDGAATLPWALRDLRPSLPAVLFYTASDKETVKDRWPDNAKGRARVELAYTEAEQAKGLMYRASLKTDYGMLFLYKEEQDELSYWMKNCRMDLSIAFVNEKGVIVKIHNRMKMPEPGLRDRDLPRYQSEAPARYAIEMEPDWFEKHGIKEGDRVFIPARLIPEA